jgi:hypothetical protein
MFRRTAVYIARYGAFSWLSVCACGHAESVRKPDPTPSSTPRKIPHTPPLAAVADGGTGADSAQAEPSAAYVQALMSQHFLITISARDSVIEGNLEALRQPLRALGAYQYPAVLPESWSWSLARLQEAARVTAEASSLDAAAKGVATMGSVCGDCHLETSGRADLGLAPGAATGKPDTLSQRMHRHRWALDRMWVGLTGPSDDAWRTGAAALAQAPAKMKRGDVALSRDFQTSVSAVRALGALALEATSSQERADVYGQALATCAHCHALRAEVEF